MKNFYRVILREAWKTCRSHLFLWPLAFCASFMGVAGSFQIFFDITDSNAPDTLTQWYGKTDFVTSVVLTWSQSLDRIPWGSLKVIDILPLAAFFLLLLLVILLAIIIVSSQGGLMYALSQLHDRKKTGYLTSFRQGLDHFWGIFGINLVYRLLYLFVIGLVITPIILTVFFTPGPFRLLLLALMYLVILPVFIVLDLVARYSMFYLVLYNQRLKEALWNGWLLFVSSWVISVETAVILFGIIIMGFFVVSFVVLPVLTLLFAMFAAMVAFSPSALNLFAVTAVTAFVALVALVVVLFTTFQMSVWIGVFKRITTGEHQSKIHRLLRHLPSLHRHLMA
ncbi:MAG: hypothetical protein A3B30_03680 [Candidatus Komeilibacteria bacterium RIFCSPLOWO2_01_FULL_52_15]|uniref:Glycerophosphoryl diester phosphodiesterase membrane domain-containing protein n=2 Tax=Candidatus Komeiliibacteriota TaxID=1817908 RepID=A0A1G2BN48_9BACT|nr:MAG: hypothetical protein A3B30_03680 [Candidatus Komeilibacteria bacterium RIFCSPLOWO2_01_FULL_52_15]OGY90578.1 MAG: hypothetical protein A2677_00790 [Candidatus Komeilibacteria bacterium RIFCSPHIGHO2_01_FULL_52_14]